MAKLNYIINTAVAAERAGVTIATIENWCRQYGIGIKVGGRWRVDPHLLSKMLRGELNEANDDY